MFVPVDEVRGGAERHEWTEQAERVAELCERWLPRLVGVYVHGSAALGGFGPASDLDVPPPCQQRTIEVRARGRKERSRPDRSLRGCSVRGHRDQRAAGRLRV